MRNKKSSVTVREFFTKFPNDESCLNHLFDVRFGQGHVCPKCERKAKWYRIQAERAYSCQWCGHHIHPTVGTPFEDTRTPLQFWFYAIYLFTTSRHFHSSWIGVIVNNCEHAVLKESRLQRM